jgi:hypothetical protein
MRADYCAGLISILALGGALSAGASSIEPNSTIINNYTPACMATDGSCSQAYLTTNAHNTTETITVPPTQSFTIGDTFNQSSGVTTVSNFGSAATGPGPRPWNFQDNYLFTTNGASVQADAISFTSSVSDLQIRIVELPGTVPTQLTYLQTTANAATLLGSSNPPIMTVENGWTNFVLAGQDFSATMPKVLAPGNYVVQVRGEATGGSSYSGDLQLTAVPLPAAAWLLLSGVGGLVGFARRRRQLAA